jgi:hypothetical protein
VLASRLTMPKSGDGDLFRTDHWVMSVIDSITFDKESMLEALVESTGLTPEEFSRDYILEEYPIEIDTFDAVFKPDFRFTVTQQFRVRPKTDAEKQLEIEKGEN